MNHLSCTNPECGCCAGTAILIPLDTANRPGLDALATRIGTHASFLETMKAKLASTQHFALRGLTTRATSDFSIALLDAWATVADVLTFYTERIVNEGYLRTATERRSLVELARLVGYRPRPGVASSVFLSFTLDEGAVTEIPAGQPANSVPGPGEKRQTFETLHALKARGALNRLRPRPTVPQEITPENVLNLVTLWFSGTDLALKPNDLLLFVDKDDAENRFMRRVAVPLPEFVEKRTRVELQLEILSSPHFVQQITRAVSELKLKTRFAFDVTTPTRDFVRDLVNVGDPLIAQLSAELPLSTLDAIVRTDLTTRKLPVSGKTYVELAAEVRKQATLAAEINTKLGKFFAAEGDFRKALRDTLSAFKGDDALRASVLTLVTTPAFGNPATARTSINELAVKVDGFALGLLSTKLKEHFATLTKAWRDAIIDTTQLASVYESAFGTAQTKFAADTAITGPIDKVLDEIGKCLNLPPSDPITTPLERIFDPAPVSLQDFANTTTDALLKERLQELLAAITVSFEALVTALKVANWPATAAGDDPALRKEVADIRTAQALLPVTPALPADAAVVAGVIDDVREIQTKTSPISDGFIELDRAADSVEAQITENKEEFVRKGTAFARRYAALRRLTGDDAAPGAAILDSLEALDLAIQPTMAEKGKRELETRPLAVLSLELDEPLRIVKDNLGKGSSSLQLTVRRLFAELRSLKLQVEQQAFRVEAGVAPVVVAGEGGLTDLLKQIGDRRAAAPGDPLRLTQDLDKLFAADDRRSSDMVARVASTLNQNTGEGLFDAWRKIRTGEPRMHVFVFRQRAAVFGNNAAPGFPIFDTTGKITGNVQLNTETLADDHTGTIFLEQENANILAPGFAVVQRLDEEPEVFGVKAVNSGPRTAYGLSAKTTALTLDDGSNWGHVAAVPTPFDPLIRKTVVYVQSEALSLAEKPVGRPVGLKRAQTATTTSSPKIIPATTTDAEQAATNPLDEDERTIMLDGLLEGLEAGRRLIISGERAGGVSGAVFKELALIESVDHVLLPSQRDPTAPLPGDTPHTRVVLAAELVFAPYKRETVQLHGNVAEATHGERQRETLGSGDARGKYQSFDLKQSPLTFVPAATAVGTESTVEVRVNNVVWHETPTFNETTPNDRVYTSEIDDDSRTHIVFGDGRQGARLPTGIGNVHARYRSGIGKPGNVKAGSISQLPSKPLGLKEVINPLAASGGADRDTSEEVRTNAPIATLALDRLVAVRDYADFARTFAGIGKASAVRLIHGAEPIVHLTIAGADDIPIDPGSRLFVSLVQALERAGDPALAFRVESRELVLLVLVAGVRVLPDYLWEKVEPKVRAALLEAFGFARRSLGQPAMLSEVVSVMQAVEGVDYIDVDNFAGIEERKIENGLRVPLGPKDIKERIADIKTPPAGTLAAVEFVPAGLADSPPGGPVRPAQLALFSPEFAATLILAEIQP